MTIFEDEIINNKVFEHASLIFTEPWTLANEIMLNIMQSLNLIFLKTSFGPTRVYVLGSISRTLHNFSTEFFSMYRVILELKNDTSVLRKNGSFANKTYCGLTALFLKKKIYFCRCNFANKQKFLVSFFRIDCSQLVEPKIFLKMFVVLEMEPQTNGHPQKMSLYNMRNW